MNRNRHLALNTLIALLALFPLTGCKVGGSASFVQGTTPEQNNATYTGEPVTGDWVVVNMLDEPEHLNPQTSTSASAQYIVNYLFETLIQTHREPPYEDIPLLADGMPEVSDDHLVYKWKLRRDAKFHDGTPMTMRDVEFSLKSLMNPWVDDLPSKPYYADLDSVVVVDDYSLVMYCSKPYFMNLQFLGGFSVMPKHIFDPKGLMDGLSYWQVKNGGGFGKIADFLETEKKVNWEDFVPSIVLVELQKSIQQTTEGKVKWPDIEKEYERNKLQGDAQGLPCFQLNYIREYFSAQADRQAALRLAQELERSIKFALQSLSLYQQIEKGQTYRGIIGVNDSVDPNAPAYEYFDAPNLYYPPLDSLGRLCRTIATRIETYGTEFNASPYNRAPTVGSGPFKFDHWTTGQELVLVRNDDYWMGPGYAYLDKIVYRVLTDYTASLVALKNGEIDFMENLQTIQYLTMTNRKSFLDMYVKSTFVIPTYSYIGWKNSHPIFKDKLVRRAMTHMVRRKEIAEKIQFGFSEVVESPFYRFGYDFNPNLDFFEFDPAKAQKLLDSAGWKDTDNDGILDKEGMKFTFEMLIPSGIPLSDQTVSIMAEDLATIGVEMTVRRLEWSVFINNYIRNHKFDGCFLAWAMGLKQDPKQIWHSASATGRGSNHVEFRNAEADSIIDVARVEFDPDKRRALYQRFQEIVHDEQPYTFMFSSKTKPAYAKRFKGVKWYPYRPGYQFDEWFVPKAEQKYK